MSKTYAIGIDMNNINTSIGIVDSQGNITNKSSISSDHQNIAEYINALHNHLTIQINQIGDFEKIKGIGIASPQGNYFTGCLEFPPMHRWSGNTPIVEILSERLQLPVTLTNNANAAAMGEMEYGIAQGMNDFILLSLDKELHRSAVANGEIIYGHKAFVGKSGHTNVHNDRGRICKCGKKDCFEAYCSTDGIVATVIELLSATPQNSVLRNIPQNKLTFDDIHQALIIGDKLAEEVYLFTADLLGQLLADLAAYSSPKAFILSGRVSNSNSFFIEAIKNAFKANVLKIYAKTKILTSNIENIDAVILGTSLLVLRSELAEVLD